MEQRSNGLGALWRARHGHRSMSLAPVPRPLGSGSPLLARGGPPVISSSRGRRFTREHFAQPVEGSVACARVGTKRSAAGLFLLVGGSLTRELERGSPAGAPDGAWVKAASAGFGSTGPSTG